MIGFQLRQRMGFECRLCRQFIEDERRERTMVMAMLFGFAPYAVCPCCYQEPEDKYDRNYRARVRRFCSKPYRIPTPLEEFTTPGGRRFQIHDGEHTPRTATRWPIAYQGEHAGTILFDLYYDREKPSFRASTRELFWRFAGDAPTGIGFDVDKSDTIEEVVAKFAHGADEILDWHEGKRVESIFIHPTGWAQKGTS
jgi:hypothetical protein